MTLEEWISSGDGREQFLIRVLEVNPSTLWRWRKGKTIPSRKYIKCIEIETQGAVRPDDWYGTQEASE